jgi:CRP-like cAMP-binding protein
MDLHSTNNINNNHLLAALSDDETQRLTAHLELVPMLTGECLYQPNKHLKYVYFPTTAIISLLYLFESGSSSEIASVGNEGMLGFSVFMGGATTNSWGVVQTAGHGYRLAEHLLREEFNRTGVMQRLLLSYTHGLTTQITQNAVCNRHHTIEQQLSRWLLLRLDRLPHTNELTMTQELIANALGVRRESITQAAGQLQSAGIISYSRGHLSILNRTGLEALSCECYTAVKKELHRLQAGYSFSKSKNMSAQIS